MRVIVHTLADITQTNVRKGNTLETQQQANLNTVMQTIGLRTLIVPRSVTHTVEDMETTSFGSLFKERQRVWHFEFESSYDGSITKETLEQDFELVPFIKQLNETAPFAHQVFRTTNPSEKNIYFEFLD